MAAAGPEQAVAAQAAAVQAAAVQAAALQAAAVQAEAETTPALQEAAERVAAAGQGLAAASSTGRRRSQPTRAAEALPRSHCWCIELDAVGRCPMAERRRRGGTQDPPASGRSSSAQSIGA